MRIMRNREYLVWVTRPGKTKAYPLSGSGVAFRRIHAEHFYIKDDTARDRFVEFIHSLRRDNPKHKFVPKVVQRDKQMFGDHTCSKQT